jgi:hypothetical protein
VKMLVRSKSGVPASDAGGVTHFSVMTPCDVRKLHISVTVFAATAAQIPRP